MAPIAKPCRNSTISSCNLTVAVFHGSWVVGSNSDLAQSMKDLNLDLAAAIDFLMAGTIKALWPIH